MKRWISILLFCGLLPGTALAQGFSVQIGVPVIRWETRPPMIEIAPGVWVVEDSDDEVFFYDQWYWIQLDGRWYRSRDHEGHWGEVGLGFVPPRLYVRERGYYQHYRGEHRPDYDDVRPAHRNDYNDVRPQARPDYDDVRPQNRPNPVYVRPVGRPAQLYDRPGVQQTRPTQAPPPRRQGKPAKGHEKPGNGHRDNGKGHDYD